MEIAVRLPFALPVGRLADAKAALRKAPKTASDAVDVAKMLATEPPAGHSDAQREYFFQASMDKWLESPEISSRTFASACIPIERAEADAIMGVWRSVTSKADALGPGYAVETPAALSRLQARVDALLAERFPHGAFVKLSTRSPKDSKTIFRRAEAAFRARVAAGEVPAAPATAAAPSGGAGGAAAAADAADAIASAAEAAAAAALNARLVAFSEEMVNAAVARSGADAVAFLLDSQRVAEDLAYAFAEGPAALPISLVVRGFDARMRPQCEFRAFVWGGRLTALGQYWHSLYFPELQDAAVQKRIAADVAALFEEIKGGLPVPNAMLDVAWLALGAAPASAGPESGAASAAVDSGSSAGGCGSAAPDAPKALLVEVNPLMEGLGSFAGSTGLFCFYKDADLLQGRSTRAESESPFEMRVRSEPEPRAQLLSHMSMEWRRVVLGF